MYKLEPVVADGVTHHLRRTSRRFPSQQDYQRIGFHCRDYFLRSGTISTLRRGAFSHNTRMRASADENGVEVPHQGHARHGHSGSDLQKINMGYTRSKTIREEDFAKSKPKFSSCQKRARCFTT